jgi:hypothetical protein
VRGKEDKSEWRKIMSTELEQVLEAARKKPMSAQEQERQRRSFAYGNAHIENARVTKAMVDEAANRISSK